MRNQIILMAILCGAFASITAAAPAGDFTSVIAQDRGAAQDIPPSRTEEEIREMSYDELRYALAEASRARNIRGLDDATMERVRREWKMIMEAMREAKQAMRAAIEDGAPPPVFTNMTLQQAIEWSAANPDTLMIACDASFGVDEVLWRRPSVESWVSRHAIAIQANFDDHPDLIRPWRMHEINIPSVVAYRSGRQFDRLGAGTTSRELVEWFEGVRNGRREIDRLREQAGDRGEDGGRVDIRPRLNFARGLARYGFLDKALDEFLWLWDHMLEFDFAMYGVRTSFMASDMTDLASKHPPARAVFQQRRDQLRVRIDDQVADRDVYIDWVSLNGVISDDQDTLTWYDSVKDDPDFDEALDHIDHDLFRLLLDRDRWADAGRVLANPVWDAADRVSYRREDEADPRESAPESDPRRLFFLEQNRQMFREDIARIYAACLAAGRLAEAREVMTLLLVFDPSARSRTTLRMAEILAGVKSDPARLEAPDDNRSP